MRSNHSTLQKQAYRSTNHRFYQNQTLVQIYNYILKQQQTKELKSLATTTKTRDNKFKQSTTTNCLTST